MVNCPTVSNTELTTPEPVDKGASKKKKKKKKKEPCNRHDFCCHEEKKEKVDSMLSKTSKCPEASEPAASSEALAPVKQATEEKVVGTGMETLYEAMQDQVLQDDSFEDAEEAAEEATKEAERKRAEEAEEARRAAEAAEVMRKAEKAADEARMEVERKAAEEAEKANNHDLGDFDFAGSCSCCMVISFNADSFMDEPKAQCTENELEQVFSSDPICFWHFYLTL